MHGTFLCLAGSFAATASSDNTAVRLARGGVKKEARSRGDRGGRGSDDARVTGETVDCNDPPTVSVKSGHSRRLEGGKDRRQRVIATPGVAVGIDVILDVENAVPPTTTRPYAGQLRSRLATTSPPDAEGAALSTTTRSYAGQPWSRRATTSPPDAESAAPSTTSSSYAGRPRSRRATAAPPAPQSPDRSHPLWQPSIPRRVGPAPKVSQAVLESAMRAASGRGESKRSTATPTSTEAVAADVTAASLGRSTIRQLACEHEDCPRRPSFGNPEDKRATRCAAHKKEGQIDVVSTRCAHPGCSRIPSFHDAGLKSPKFCAAHKRPGMRDYHSQTRKCMHPGGCDRTPSFGFEDCKRTACAQHRVEGMVNRNIQCGSDNCRLVPAFGLRGEGPSFCAKHKAPGMVNVVSRRCQHPSCDRIPSYGREGDGRKASFCKAHKADDMINVKHPRCAQAECLRQPGFGMPGGKAAVFCKQHKAPGMVDVKNNYARKRARRAE